MSKKQKEYEFSRLDFINWDLGVPFENQVYPVPDENGIYHLFSVVSDVKFYLSVYVEF